MSKDLSKKENSELMSAKGTIEEIEEVKPQKVGISDYILVYGAGAFPIAGPVAAGMALDPVWGILSIPFAALASLGFFSVRAAKLSARVGQHIRVARESWRKEKQGAFEKSLTGTSNQQNSGEKSITKSLAIAHSKLDVTLNAPISGNNIVNQFSSIFGAKKAYMDSHKMKNLSRDESYEYTFKMMKLVSVKKINRTDEESVWEELYLKALE